MNRQFALLSGIGLGAGLMYILDPDRGNRRQALLRDKLTRAAHRTPQLIEATARDFANRARGVVSTGASMFTSDEVSDEVLEERVRSKMGRVVSHPGAITVTASGGRVTLRGPILENEVDELLSTISRIPGVSEIDNQLEVHKQAGDLPGLQGGRRRPGRQFELMQENWSPAARLLAGSLGGALAGYGLIRRDPLGIGMGLIGAGLLLRGATNMSFKRLTGIGAGRRAVEIQKTININAPIDEVYPFWTNYQNFAFFMSNVVEVKETGNAISHWTVKGPAGVPIEWDAVVTRHEPNKVFAWKSVEGAIIEHAGLVRFVPNTDADSTRVHLRLSYNPPAGALGHAAATILGANPRAQLDEDLKRMKSIIEMSHRAHNHEELREKSRVASVKH